ncbi:hypothetical protein HZS61_014348 [Fusarium oxysporum f. sp. conglutinans]|uniref:Uncharacterized protein n=2 Tax=Fusarium oxysporum TaxID=5507 RepID=A0A8H6GSM9_FUSOX|nr:hypothetical protein HZS61_014348 [Fusarium oxysporum f. sp. conglutinans]PCD42505.1 hypothetical protein AU210_005033 [Fusarium oxysporum f. sp. radicis-cucumerinum]
MGNFGTAVNSLLGTYTKCLSLLKGFPKDEDAGTLKLECDENMLHDFHKMVLGLKKVMLLHDRLLGAL